MADFLTPISNGTTAYAGTWAYLVLNLMLYAASFLTIKYYRHHPDDRRLLKVLAVLQAVDFLTTHIWYFAVGYMAFPLPLFYCRIAKLIFIPLAFSSDPHAGRGLRVYAIPMSIVGAIAAFLVPDPDPFVWPHLTHVTYFFGHFILMLLSLGLLLTDQRPWIIRDLAKGQIILLVINILITPVARVTDINYAYLLESPLFKEALATLPPVVYTLVIYVAYAILFTIAFGLVQMLHRIVTREWTRTHATA